MSEIKGSILGDTDLIQAKKEVVLKAKELDDKVKTMLKRRLDLLNHIDEVTLKEIKPCKDEISQIDAELELVMAATGVKKITIDNYGAYMKDEISIKVVDPKKALAWANKHPEVIKKDILKKSSIFKLMKEGVVPNPERDGIDCNDSYQKLSFRRN